MACSIYKYFYISCISSVMFLDLNENIIGFIWWWKNTHESNQIGLVNYSLLFSFSLLTNIRTIICNLFLDQYSWQIQFYLDLIACEKISPNITSQLGYCYILLLMVSQNCNESSHSHTLWQTNVLDFIKLWHNYDIMPWVSKV